MNIRHIDTRYSPIMIPSYDGHLKRNFHYSFNIERNESDKKLIVCLSYTLKTIDEKEAFDLLKSISEYSILGLVTMIDLYNVINFTGNTLRGYLGKEDRIPIPLREVPGQSPELMRDELIGVLEQLNS